VFDGSFPEWETVSEERAHAASVRASEEAALRRHDEKKRTARREERGSGGSPAPRKAIREARAKADEAERLVSELELEVTTLTTTLDDPALYTRPGGVEEARKLGVRLDTLRKRLDKALAAWERETASLEALERTTVP
jgi:hypothetical protein